VTRRVRAACDPSFSLCLGQGKWLQGLEARRLTTACMGCPQRLLPALELSARRRANQIPRQSFVTPATPTSRQRVVTGLVHEPAG
jgi:hypothetical protein